MEKQPLASPPLAPPPSAAPLPSEPVSQFLRSVEKIQLAKAAGQDPALYESNARQWLAIVRLSSPAEAKALEQKLKGTGAALPAEAAGPPPPVTAPDLRASIRHIAWAGVLFALVFMLVGPNLLVHVIAFIALTCLLAVILVTQWPP